MNTKSDSTFFVLNGQILSDNVGKILLSLFDTFKNEYRKNINYNIEYSQYYALDRHLLQFNDTVGNNIYFKTESCELVLKYFSSDISLNNGQFSDDTTNKHILTHINRGIVKFFAKQNSSNNSKYTPIEIIKIVGPRKISDFKNNLYMDDIILGKINSIIHSKISDYANKKIHAYGNNNTDTSIKNIVSMIDECKDDIMDIVSKSIKHNIFTNKPNINNITVANTIAKNIKILDPNANVIIVPSIHKVILDVRTKNCTIDINGTNGITMLTDSSSDNTYSIPITSNLMVIDGPVTIGNSPVSSFVKYNENLYYYKPDYPDIINGDTATIEQLMIDRDPDTTSIETIKNSKNNIVFNKINPN
jgi:hypothetical protein